MFHHPETMTYFMESLGTECLGGSTWRGIPYCNQEEGKGNYYLGPYAGDEDDQQFWKSIKYMPSTYATYGNWEDYAETFTSVISTTYFESGNGLEYWNESYGVYLSFRNRDIGMRRTVMTSIIDGTWRKR